MPFSFEMASLHGAYVPALQNNKTAAWIHTTAGGILWVYAQNKITISAEVVKSFLKAVGWCVLRFRLKGVGPFVTLGAKANSRNRPFVVGRCLFRGAGARADCVTKFWGDPVGSPL